MSLDERRQYNIKFNNLKNEMCEYFLKIINGRINSFRLRTSMRNYDDINDIVQDAFITVMTYINRYNDEQATSAFAYVTQLATNSILFSLNEIKGQHYCWPLIFQLVFRLTFVVRDFWRYTVP